MENIYQCQQCPRTFVWLEFFERHQRAHLLKKPHRCGICGAIYGAANGLQQHLLIHRPMIDQDHKKEHQEINTNSGGVSVDLAGVSQGKSSTGSRKVFDNEHRNSGVDERRVATAQSNERGFYECRICRREFSGLRSLQKHMPIHGRKIQHKCELCSFVFGKKEYLLGHMRKHTGESCPSCDVCGLTFKRTSKLKKHFIVHLNTNTESTIRSAMPFQCHICKTAFDRAGVLSHHLSTSHAAMVQKCDQCEATFHDIRGKINHMFYEHRIDNFGQKKVWCNICRQGFTRPYNLKLHQLKTHVSKFLVANLSSTELTTVVPPEQPGPTQTSGLSPSSDLDSRNTEAPKPNCPKLARKSIERSEFGTKNPLKENIDRPSLDQGHKLRIDSETKAGCSGRSFSATNRISDYEYQIRNEIWPLNCIECNIILGTLPNFTRHMNEHWTTSRRCVICGLSINSKRFNFKQHLMVHTGEKPFKCHICDRHFRQKVHMVKHIATHGPCQDL